MQKQNEQGKDANLERWTELEVWQYIVQQSLTHI